ncbi:solute carrier family 22 member 15-like isoform X2 [Dendronephthya gigantea]|uniref:solute carrier family 22 member 15-like isoform X2 n=1 Tax=Dendronephthya gigantea TaxID=151771 RepID=UPI00106AA943|nr:solute carrier family 22 member 15-like isoform X2 [Dendronephthya gigantea]
MIFFIRNYIAFVILRFILGAVLQGMDAGYILIIELFALKYRSRVGTIQTTFWPVGVMFLALIAFLIQDWRYIQLFITLATILQISLIWFSISVGYYGVSLNISSLAGNKYLNFFIGGTLELIPYFLTVFITERFGRRKPLCTYLMIGAVMNITAGVLSEKAADNDALQDLTTALAIIGRIGFSGSFSVLFIYTSELFPTEIRNVGLGACMSWTRFGGMIAPQILLLGEKSKKSVPFIIFGRFSFIASLSSLLLFETLNKKLSDTIREEEKDDSSEEMNIPVEETRLFR